MLSALEHSESLSELEKVAGLPAGLRNGELVRMLRREFGAKDGPGIEVAMGEGVKGGANEPGPRSGHRGRSTVSDRRHVFLYTDGASRGNPGPAAIGVVAVDDAGDSVGEFSRPIGRATNNTAEYRAVIEGLAYVGSLGYRNVSLRLDSELVARQLLGEYRVKSPDLRPLFEEAVRQLQNFHRWNVEHVPRKENQRADQLANEALN